MKKLGFSQERQSSWCYGWKAAFLHTSRGHGKSSVFLMIFNTKSKNGSPNTQIFRFTPNGIHPMGYCRIVERKQKAPLLSGTKKKQYDIKTICCAVANTSTKNGNLCISMEYYQMLTNMCAANKRCTACITKDRQRLLKHRVQPQFIHTCFVRLRKKSRIS